MAWSDVWTRIEYAAAVVRRKERLTWLSLRLKQYVN